MVTSELYLVGNHRYHYMRSIKCFRPSQGIRHSRTDVAGHTSPKCCDDDRICPLAAKLPTYLDHEPHWNVAASEQRNAGHTAAMFNSPNHCLAIVSLLLAITYSQRFRGSGCTYGFETKPSDLGVADDDDGGSDVRSLYVGLNREASGVAL